MSIVINIWKKGSSRASTADYHLEVVLGETNQIAELIEAVHDIANAIKEVER